MMIYALTIEKKQTYKLTARHRLPRCELVDCWYFLKIVKMFELFWGSLEKHILRWGSVAKYLHVTALEFYHH